MELLEKYGIEVRKNPFGRKLTEEETIAHLQGADGLLAGLEPLDERVFSACPQLKAIARIGIGMDNVDAEAAKRHGIKVSNTPDAPTEAVAEMTLAALLTIAHQIVPANADVHGGVWKKRMGFSIRGTKVLVVGYGRIGRRTAELMQSLGAEIAVYDKYAAALSTCSLEEGLGWADVITLHAAGADPAVLLLPGEDRVYVALRPFLQPPVLQKPRQGDEAVQPVGHPLPALPVAADPSAVPHVRPDQVQMPCQPLGLELQLPPQPPFRFDVCGLEIHEFP